jgi:hypothetical protein
LRLFAANALYRTTSALSGLFTLITEHEEPPVSLRVSVGYR